MSYSKNSMKGLTSILVLLVLLAGFSLYKVIGKDPAAGRRVNVKERIESIESIVRNGNSIQR